ncbi:hypothetical protein QYF36_014296 [Acer negundo]|nr:hypothetical protein QYF36_014296 [Acer negundo]
MVVEPFYFYLVSLDEVKCLVDDNSTNSGYIDIYILHLALIIIISICFYNQLRLVRLLQSGLFPVVFDIALLFFSTLVVTSTRIETAATSDVILMLVYLGKNLQLTDNTSQDLLVLLIVLSGVYFGVLLLGSLKTHYDLLRNPDGVHGGGMVFPGPDSPEDKAPLATSFYSYWFLVLMF